MDEQIFETLAKDTLRKIADSIELAAQAADSDLDVDLDNSVLTIELENDQSFLIKKPYTRQAPNMFWTKFIIKG